MRYALFVMILACGEKDEDTAAVEEEVQVEAEDTSGEETEGGDTSEEAEAEEGE